MAANLSQDEMTHLINYYEQKFFTFDKPILFKGDLSIYPIVVKDYYLFYSCINAIKLDKNATMEGISMSDLQYLLWCIENNEDGKSLFSNLTQLFEIVFHISNGRFCPICGDVITYDQVNEYLNSIKDIQDMNKQQEEIQKYISKVQFCSHCSNDQNIVERLDTIRYVNKENDYKLFVMNTEMDSNEFVLLKNIILHYNIPDYNDEYVDPELKKDLEEVAKLKNPNNAQPSLEKQVCCILSASSVYNFETIQSITIRKLVLLLRTIDARLHYFVYRQGEASGMIKFSGELTHWIYGSDKKSKYDELMSLDQFKDKMKDVT